MRDLAHEECNYTIGFVMGLFHGESAPTHVELDTTREGVKFMEGRDRGIVARSRYQPGRPKA